MSCVNVRLIADCQAHGWLSVWISKWTIKADAGSEWANSRNKCRGEQRDVKAAAGDCWLHNGWRVRGLRGCGGGLRWDGLGWGLSMAERRPQPRGTLMQRAIDMEALCGLNCSLLAAGAKAPATKKDKRKGNKIKSKKEGDSRIHPCLNLSFCVLLSLRKPTAKPLLHPLNGCCWIFDRAKILYT